MITSGQRFRHQGGFTLVELGVVLLILIIFAAMITPNLVNMRKAQQQRASYGQVLDLLAEARLSAIENNTTYAVTWDSGTSGFDLKKEPLVNQGNSSAAIPDPAQRPLQQASNINEFEQVKTLALPTPLQADTFRIGANTSDSGSFALHFYADGSSDGGGFQISSQGQNIRSIVVDKYGISTITDGALPDTTDQLWTAGTYAQKI